jgi:radical SAM superfamily enzyme YgiQ (UPF0313 family)
MIPARFISRFSRVPASPFYQPRPPLWQPPEMTCAPALANLKPGPLEHQFALLINPFYPKNPHGSFGKHSLTPSLALTTVAAATPTSWRVAVWDENCLQGPPPVHPLPEVVGLAVHLCFTQRSYELARWFRQHGTKVVLGGPHVQSCPDEAASHADALAIGDGVQIWPQMLKDVVRNRLQPRYEAGFERPYDLDPPPRRNLLPQADFLTPLSLIASRGCPNRCNFCYLSTGSLRQPFSTRHPADVARQFAESEEPYGVFLDNNFGAHPGYVLRLCRELAPLQKIWSAAVTLDITDDPGLVRAMALAGCTGVFVGFESLNEDNLRQAGKRTPPPADYDRRVQIFHDHGIQVNGSFVLGFDGDQKDVFGRTAEWIEVNRLECATFHILTPYPGTPLFTLLADTGRLLHRQWEKYDTAHAVFRPRHMTPEELELGYDWLYRRLFSWDSIWRRRPAQEAAVMPYLMMSWLYKRNNHLWRFLIKHQLVHRVWQPLISWSRWRHLSYRKRLQEATDEQEKHQPSVCCICTKSFSAITQSSRVKDS